MERILNGSAAEPQFVAILIAAAVEIQAEADRLYRPAVLYPDENRNNRKKRIQRALRKDR